MSKFFTYEDRLEIEAYLKQDMTFGAIAKKLEKHRTTISKEIQHHSIERKSGYADIRLTPAFIVSAAPNNMSVLVNAAGRRQRHAVTAAV